MTMTLPADVFSNIASFLRMDTSSFATLAGVPNCTELFIRLEYVDDMNLKHVKLSQFTSLLLKYKDIFTLKEELHIRLITATRDQSHPDSISLIDGSEQFMSYQQGITLENLEEYFSLITWKPVELRKLSFVVVTKTDFPRFRPVIYFDADFSDFLTKFCAHEVTSLHLERFGVIGMLSLNLPSVKHIVFREGSVHDDSSVFTMNCPDLECFEGSVHRNLELAKCTELKFVRVSNATLQDVVSLTNLVKLDVCTFDSKTMVPGRYLKSSQIEQIDLRPLKKLNELFVTAVEAEILFPNSLENVGFRWYGQIGVFRKTLYNLIECANIQCLQLGWISSFKTDDLLQPLKLLQHLKALSLDLTSYDAAHGKKLLVDLIGHLPELVAFGPGLELDGRILVPFQNYRNLAF